MITIHMRRAIIRKCMNKRMIQDYLGEATHMISIWIIVTRHDMTITRRPRSRTVHLRFINPQLYLFAMLQVHRRSLGATTPEPTIHSPVAICLQNIQVLDRLRRLSLEVPFHQEDTSSHRQATDLIPLNMNIRKYMRSIMATHQDIPKKLRVQCM